jgi:hypothetical protein
LSTLPSSAADCATAVWPAIGAASAVDASEPTAMIIAASIDKTERISIFPFEIYDETIPG